MMGGAEIATCVDLGLLQGFLGVALFLTLRVLNFTDLTCEGSFVFGACTASVLLTKGYPIPVSLAASFLAGSVAGAVTGVLNIFLKVKDILAGILVAFMFYSINLRVLKDAPNITLPEGAQLTGLYIFCAATVLMLGYMLRTDWGLALRAVGQNPQLAQLSGISVKKMTFLGLALSNALIGLAGSLTSLRQGFCDVSSGTGLIIVGLASVVIGEKIMPFQNLFLQLLGCFAGAVLYRFFMGLALELECLNLKSSDVNLISGLLILSVMALRKRRRLCCT
ncbi:ABC transporter permease [Alphaproteobacteria bacterium]|nr:ABC transporter permease [Alphaproteobacteria bacterium]